jgi:hypothetical protein
MILTVGFYLCETCNLDGKGTQVEDIQKYGAEKKH